MKFLTRNATKSISLHRLIFQSRESFGGGSVVECVSQGNNTGNELQGLVRSILTGQRAIGRSGPTAGDNCTSCHSNGEDLGRSNAGGADRLAILAPVFDNRNVGHDNLSDQPNICGDGMFDESGITYLTSDPGGNVHRMTRFLPDPNSRGMLGMTTVYQGTERVTAPSYFSVNNGEQMRTDLENYLIRQRAVQQGTN